MTKTTPRSHNSGASELYTWLSTVSLKGVAWYRVHKENWSFIQNHCIRSRNYLLQSRKARDHNDLEMDSFSSALTDGITTISAYSSPGIRMLPPRAIPPQWKILQWFATMTWISLAKSPPVLLFSGTNFFKIPWITFEIQRLQVRPLDIQIVDSPCALYSIRSRCYNGLLQWSESSYEKVRLFYFFHEQKFLKSYE